MSRKISLLLICIVLLTAVSACRKDNPKIKETDQVTEDHNNRNNNQAATGRYVEEELELPEGILPTEFAGLAIAPDGIPELYVNHNGTYEKYKYIEQTWNKEDAGGLKAFHNYSGNFILTDVFYGEDGKQYLIGDTMEYHNALYRLNDQGEYEKIVIPKFDELIEDWNTPVAMRARLIKVLENGMIAALFQRGELVVFSPDGQTVEEELNSNYNGKMAAEGNVLYYTNESGNELTWINLETGEEATGTIKIESTDTGIMETGILEIYQDSVFLCDKKGIHSYQLEGSIWETIVEGSQSSLSMPSQTLNKFLIGSVEDFYVILMAEQSATIKHIFYDSNALSVPPTELSIFSLEDNKTIRQAVSTFNANHPEVKITYRVAKQDQKAKFTYGIKNPKQTIPDNDYINALNTELLADRGADILVLDGLSATSYIEKGVLEDMGDLFQPMIDSGELLNNIAENYLTDGKVYVMPARIRVPVIYGKTEAVNASDTLKDLAEYAGNNTEPPLFDQSNYRALAAWCYLLYKDQLVNEDNEIDEASLQAFLENIQTISENIKASDEATMSGKNYSSGAIYGGYWISGDISVYKKLVQANMEVLSEFDDFATPLTVTAKWSGDYKIINNTYEENALVGINSTGKNKDLAKEFVQLLFSEEIQNLSGMEGFPMNTKAMEKMVQSSKPGAISYGTQDILIQSAFPTSEVKGRIAEEIRGLSHPVANDTTLLNMILDEAERYLRGDITAEQAAQNAVGSINTYLNE